MATRIAVVGGGPNGVIALKKLVEDGFDVTLFEGRSWVGGLWKPNADDNDLSALSTTHFNSSKYTAPISDFPMPEEMDDFPTAPQLYKYFNDYADHFQLRPYIRLETKVTEIERSGDVWILKLLHKGQPGPSTEFDKVVFATGTFIQPKFPKLEDVEAFAGPMNHCVEFNDPTKYAEQTVLIVGLHASAQDTIAALFGHATKVYVAHRSGLSLLPRYAADGAVYDSLQSVTFYLVSYYVSFLFPALWTWFLDFVIGYTSRKAFPNQPASWGLAPAPSVAVTTPLIASAIWPHLESGFCEPVRPVKRFTGPRSVELTDGRVLDGIDSVIYCTGYNSILPVKMPVDLDPYPVPGEYSTWYRNMFPMHPDSNIRNSLAMLGHNALTLPGWSQFEAQASAVSQIWQGKHSPPSLSEMKSYHSKCLATRAATAKKYRAQETFYPIIDASPQSAAWLDRTAGLGLKQHFGLVERWTNLCAWKLWWNDRELWNLCLYGLGTPAIYALFDVGGRKAWRGAREQIFKDNEAVKRQKERRMEAMRKEGKVE